MDDERTAATAHREDEISRFIEQARWLLDYHDRRGESLSTRAVALLGFVGVALALLLNFRLPRGVEVNDQVTLFYVATVVLLLATAGCCVWALMVRTLTAPGIGQLRGNWLAWVEIKRRDRAAKDIAEGLLGGKDLEKDSPLDRAVKAANGRARAVKFAAVARWACPSCHLVSSCTLSECRWTARRDARD